MKFQFSVTDAQTQAELSRLIKKGKSLSDLMSKIGTFVINRTRLSFRQSVDPYGKPWEPLKVRKGQPLVDTGRLRRSIVQKTGPDFVDVGTNVKYAKIHQFGGTVKAQNKPYLVFKVPGGGWIKTKSVYIPARPYLPLKGLPKSWGTPVSAIIKGWLRNA